jgi:hypothetical protein
MQSSVPGILDRISPWWYAFFMRVKTSISLSAEVLKEIASLTSDGERSDFIEKALWNYIQFLHHNQRNHNDLDIINNAAHFLNEEALFFPIRNPFKTWRFVACL